MFLNSGHQLQEMIIGEKIRTKIDVLAKQKYQSYSWIYGWSPDYIFKNHFEQKNSYTIKLQVKKAMIIDAEVYIENQEELGKLFARKLIGNPHHLEALSNDLNLLCGKLDLNKKESKEFISNFF